MTILCKNLDKDTIYCLDFEYRESPSKCYDLVCVCAYTQNHPPLQWWLADGSDRESFIQWLLYNKDKYFIAHWLHAEATSLLSFEDERIEEVFDSLKFFDTWMLAKLLTNTDDKARKPKLALDHLVKKYDIFDYGSLKEDTRKIIINNHTYTELQKLQILNYCSTDCEVNYKLFFRLAEEHEKTFNRPLKVENELVRSNYVKAQSRGSFNGMPIRLDILDDLKDNYYHLLSYFFDKMGDKAKSIYNYQGLKPKFVHQRAAELVKELEREQNFVWRKTDTGKYSFEGDTLKLYSGRAEWVADLKSFMSKHRSLVMVSYDAEKMAKQRIVNSEYHYTEEDMKALTKEYNDFKNKIKKEKGLKSVSQQVVESEAKHNKEAMEALISKEMAKCVKLSLQSEGSEEESRKQTLFEAIKDDGRVHSEWGVCKNVSWRNAPKASNFLCAMPAYLRMLHRVPEGEVFCETDVVSEEIVIAALISGDQEMLNATSEDFYQYTAYLMGLADKGDVALAKDEFNGKHGKLRATIKAVALASNYGATEISLSLTLFGNLEPERKRQAKDWLDLYKKAYPVYFKFSEICKERKALPTIYKEIGYRYILNSNSASNFYIQGAGARALMHTVPAISNKAAIDKGIKYCTSIHDGILSFIKDDNNYTQNLDYVEDSFRKGVFEAALCNRFSLLNKDGEVFSYKDIGMETTCFRTGELAYSKDLETSKEILSVIQQIKS